MGISGDLDRLAKRRLDALRKSSYAKLLDMNDTPTTLRRWGGLLKGSVRSEITPIQDGRLRVAVLQHASSPLWSSYYHNVDGFILDREGRRVELREIDYRELD